METERGRNLAMLRAVESERCGFSQHRGADASLGHQTTLNSTLRCLAEKGSVGFPPIRDASLRTCVAVETVRPGDLNQNNSENVGRGWDSMELVVGKVVRAGEYCFCGNLLHVNKITGIQNENEKQFSEEPFET